MGRLSDKEAVIEYGGVADVTGDDSVAYKDWKDYEEAVKKGVEAAPVIEKDLETRNKRFEFNVDEALDSIDLTFNGYTPSKDALEFFNLMRLVHGGDFEVGNSLTHYFLVDLVFGNIARENFPYSDEIRSKIRINARKIAIIASRFTAKSTIITGFIPIYCAITGKLPGFGDVMFWVGFGDSQQAGAKVQANTIRDMCQDSEFCKHYFEKMRFTDEECEFLRKGTEPIKQRAFMFKVKGAAGGSVRGIRYKTERPQIFSFDDIIKNEADANSPIIMGKLKSMIYSDADNATGKRGKIIIVNTPFNKNDPVYSALESGVWTPVCIPLCEKIYLGMEKKDYRGSWEQMKPFEEVMEKYEDAYDGGTLREFNQELMLRISSEDDRLVSDDMISNMWYSKNGMTTHLDGYNLVATTDFTASNELKGDFSCIAIWALNSNRDWFMLDLVVKRMTIDEQYDRLLQLVQMWTHRTGKHLTVGIEVDGQQRLNIHSLKEKQIAKNVWFTFATQIGDKPGGIGISRRRAGGDKHAQFMRVHNWLQQGKVYLPEELKGTPDMKELLDELRYISYTSINSKHDDALDVVSMCAVMDITYPSVEANGGGTERMYEKSDVWGEVDGNKVDEFANSLVF